tara:strand:+ start:177 stop:1073 length:897 start_codon:yes stop_codon:yes gene_type:complete
MSIKLNGATSGSVELDVPAAVGSDLQLTLPATAGEVAVKATDGSVDLGDLVIDSSGRVGIGTTDFAGTSTYADNLVVKDATDAGVTIQGANNTSEYSSLYLSDTTTNRGWLEQSLGGGSTSTLTIGTAGLTRFYNNSGERMRISSSGEISAQGIHDTTSAGAANVYVHPTNYILHRSTSSIKYKRNVEDLKDSYADAILGCRPVWYQSKCKNDNQNWGYWGFIAEEVAEIDPRLVSWKTGEISVDEKGKQTETLLETPVAEGVQYDRFVPHLLNLIKRQQQAIQTLETKVAALEGGAS